MVDIYFDILLSLRIFSNIDKICTDNFGPQFQSYTFQPSSFSHLFNPKNPPLFITIFQRNNYPLSPFPSLFQHLKTTRQTPKSSGNLQIEPRPAHIFSITNRLLSFNATSSSDESELNNKKSLPLPLNIFFHFLGVSGQAPTNKQQPAHPNISERSTTNQEGMETCLRISQICPEKAFICDISHFYCFVYKHICRYISCFYYIYIFLIFTHIIMVNYLFLFVVLNVNFITISNSSLIVLIVFISHFISVLL